MAIQQQLQALDLPFRIQCLGIMIAWNASLAALTQHVVCNILLLLLLQAALYRLNVKEEHHKALHAQQGQPVIGNGT